MPSAGVSDLPAIRAFVHTTAGSLGARPEAVDDLVLAVDDAAANVITHGYGGRGGPLEVEVSGDGLEVAFVRVIGHRWSIHRATGP
jgi:anti-sigma regulatory factor (Ser/Thr protein kinase)